MEVGLPVRAKYLSKVQYWLVHAADHPDAYWLMNDEVVKLNKRLFVRTYGGEDTIPGLAEQTFDSEIEAEQGRLREATCQAVAASPGGFIPFGSLRGQARGRVLWPRRFPRTRSEPGDVAAA